MPINNSVELGTLLGDSASKADNYQDSFIETEMLGDIVLTGLNTVNLVTTTLICKQDIGNHFTLDHPVNGELDSSTLELDTGLGGKVCPFYIIGDIVYDYFTEYFNSETFKSTGTANWDITNEVLRMSTSTSHFPPSTKYQDIGSINTESSSTISSILLECSETKWNSSDSIRYFASSDNKSTWTELTKGTLTSLSTSGSSIYVRVIFTGNGNYDTYIDNLTLRFNA